MTGADLTIQQVCGQDRLGKSTRWLQGRLTEDRRRQPGEQRLQHHHYVGRTPRWTETEYQALRAAIVAQDTAARAGSMSKPETGAGTSSARSGSRAAQSALERVLALKPRPSIGTPPASSATTGPARSGRTSSTASSHPSRSPLRLISTSPVDGDDR